MPTPISGSSEPDSILPASPLGTGDAPPSAPSGPIDTIGPSSSTPISTMSTLGSIELEQPKTGLLPFLTILSNMKLEHKRTVADTQEEVLNVNRNFFLSVSQDIVDVKAYRDVAMRYFRDQNAIIENQNQLIEDLNREINFYNITSAESAPQIATLLSAIAAFNASNPASPSFPAAVAAFNQAVNNFNSYIFNSANPALAQYQTAINNYLNGTANNEAATATFNQWVTEQNTERGLSLSHMSLNAPQPFPGIGGLLPQALTFPASGTPPNVSLYTPHIIVPLPYLEQLPEVPEDIDGLVGEAIINQLSALTQMRVIFSDISDYQAFLAFVLKTGTTPSPAAITAYISNAEKPSLNTAGSIGSQGGSVSMGSFVLGLNSPFLEGKIANSLYTAAMENFDRQVAQNFIDQINMFNEQIISIASLKAGFIAAETIREQSELVSDEILETLVTALFLGELLKIITTSGETLQPSIEYFLNESGEVPPDQLTELVQDLSSAQNLSLVLQGALSVGIATGDTGFVGALLNSIPSLSTVTSQVSAEPLPNLFSAFTDPTNQLILKTSLNQELLNDTTITADDTRLSLLNEVVDRTIAQSTQDTNAEDFRTTLEQNLLASDLSAAQAALISDRALQIAQGLTTPTILSTPVSTADLAASVTATLAERLAPLGSELASEVAENVGRLIYNPLTPESTLAKLIENYIEAQTKISDRAREDVIEELLSVIPPAELQVIKPAVLLLQLLDPGYNISKSFMTGLMYDRSIPTNFKRPLNIQI